MPYAKEHGEQISYQTSSLAMMAGINLAIDAAPLGGASERALVVSILAANPSHPLRGLPV
jgi:hypothetical protein